MQRYIISIGSGGMNILNDIKSLGSDAKFLYINRIDYEAGEDGLTPLFDKIDDNQKIILDDNDIKSNLTQKLKDVKKVDIILTFGSKTAKNAPEILNIFKQFDIKSKVYGVMPFGFEDENRQKIAKDNLDKIRMLTEEIFIFYNDELLKKENIKNMNKLFKSLSKDIYNSIKEDNHDL